MQRIQNRYTNDFFTFKEYANYLREDLSEDPETKDIFKEYEAIFNISDDLKSNFFYTYNIIKFKPIKYEIPFDTSLVDWDFLSQLIASSNTIECRLIKTDLPLPEMEVTVFSESENGERKGTTKVVSELLPSQINRLTEILINYQISLVVLEFCDHDESIKIQNIQQLLAWNKIIDGY